MVNQEKCYTMEEIKNNPTQYIKRFSEGSTSLEEVLTLCYSNNIGTRACCKGHDATEQKIFNNDNTEPYIVFEFDEKNENILLDFSIIMQIMQSLNYPIKTTIDVNDNKILLVIRGKSVLKESSDIFFNIIKESINKALNEKIETNMYYKIIFVARQMLEKIKQNGKTKLSFYVTNNKMEIDVFESVTDENVGFTLFSKAENIKQNEVLIQYIESLTDLSDFDCTMLKSSFTLNEIELERIYNAIKKLCSEKKY